MALDPNIEALIAYLMQQGQMDPATLDLSFGRTPDEYDKDGNLIPPDLDIQSDMLSFLRGQNTLLADPVTGAMAGPAGFDYDAFAPTITDEPVDRPGERALAGYQQRGGWEGMVAEKIASGGSASEAFALVNQILSDPTNPAYADIASSLEPIYDSATGGPRLDDKGKPMLDKSEVRSFARDLEKNFISDPIGNYQDPITRQWFNRTEEPSKAAAAFTDKGWALPSDRYNIDEMMGPEWSAQTQGMDPRAYRQMIDQEIRPAAELQARGIDSQVNDVNRRLSSTQQSMAGPAGSVPAASSAGPASIPKPSSEGVPYLPDFLDPLQGKFLPPNDPLDVVNMIPGVDIPGPLDLAKGGFNLLRGSKAEAAPTPNTGTGIAKEMGLDMDQVTPKLLEFLMADEKKKKAAGGPPGGRPGSPDDSVRRLRSQQTALRGAGDAADLDMAKLYNGDYFYNQGQLSKAKKEGRTPLIDQFMARRMATISSGLPGGFYPGGA